MAPAGCPGRPAGRLVTVRAGTLQLSLGVLGAGLEGGPGVFGRRDLGFEGRSQPGLVPRGVLAGLVQLRAGRLGRLPRLGRILPGAPGPELGRRRPLLGGPPGLGNLCPRGLGLLLGGSLRRQRPGQPGIGLLRRSTRLSGLSLGPRAAPPERGPRAGRIQRPGRTAIVPGQQLPPPERRQRRMRLPGHRVRQPAVPRLRPLSCPGLRLILTARIRASEDTLSGLDHRQAPFSADQHSVTGPGRPEPVHPGHHPGGSHGCWPAWHGLLQG